MCASDLHTTPQGQQGIPYGDRGNLQPQPLRFIYSSTVCRLSALSPFDQGPPVYTYLLSIPVPPSLLATGQGENMDATQSTEWRRIPFEPLLAAVCPLSQAMIENPVIGSDDRIYERTHLELYLRIQGQRRRPAVSPAGELLTHLITSPPQLSCVLIRFLP